MPKVSSVEINRTTGACACLGIGDADNCWAWYFPRLERKPVIPST